MKNKLLLIILPFVLLISCNVSDPAENNKIYQLFDDLRKEIWNEVGAPNKFGLAEGYSYNYSELPKSGQAEHETWAGWYWATYKDAINYKWAGESSDSPTSKYAKAFGIDPKALEDAVSKRSGINSQSRNKACTENSDCTDLENGSVCAKRFGEEKGYCIPTWFGQCHAWAPAAIMEVEPKFPVKVNGVTFEPQDIKALITYVYNNVKTEFLGARCNVDEKKIKFDITGRPSSVECRDVNPGAMHVILTNWLGIHKKPFLEDRTYDDEVWNQPVRSFEVTYDQEVTKEEAAKLIDSNYNIERNKTTSERVDVVRGEWVHLPGSYSGIVEILMAGNGDADLYVRDGADATEKGYDCRPWLNGSKEYCKLSGDDLRISIYGYQTSSVKLKIREGGTYFDTKAVTFRHVRTNVNYITESRPTDNGNLDEDRYTVTDRVEYILELDDGGNIIGGEWLKQKLHADFFWVPIASAGDFKVGNYTFEYAKIKKILQESVIDTGTRIKESGSIAKNEWKYYGPYNAENGISANLSGTGKINLYVKLGSRPKFYSYDCRSFRRRSRERCSVSGNGNFYIALHASRDGNYELDLLIRPASDNGENITSVGENVISNGDFENWINGMLDGWQGRGTNIGYFERVETDNSIKIRLVNTKPTPERFITEPMSLSSGVYKCNAEVSGNGYIRFGYKTNESFFNRSTLFDRFRSNGELSEYKIKLSQDIKKFQLILSVKETSGNHLLVDNVSCIKQ